MGTFTVSKKIVKQGHTLAVNLTNECKLYSIKAGDIINITVITNDKDVGEDND